MIRVLPIIALAGLLAGPVIADEDKMSADLSCADYLDMGDSDQVKAMQKLVGTMPEDLQVVDKKVTDVKSDVTKSMDENASADSNMGSGTMSIDQRVADARKGCEASKDGSVIDALKEMAKS